MVRNETHCDGVQHAILNRANSDKASGEGDRMGNDALGGTSLTREQEGKIELQANPC